MGHFIGLFGIDCAFYIFGISVIGFTTIAIGTQVPHDGSLTTHDELDPLYITPTKGYYTYSPDTETEIIRRMDSSTSHANTLLIDSEQSLLNLQRTVTSIAARDVHDEANLILDQMDDNTLPPLGLTLSHIPTLDTSLAAFASIGCHDSNESTTEEESLRDTIFASPKVWSFLLMTLFFGIFYSMVAQFLFLFLKQDLDLDSSVIGWTGPIGGLTEVSTFYVSRLVRKERMIMM